jgi:hypothetical protein
MRNGLSVLSLFLMLLSASAAFGLNSTASVLIPGTTAGAKTGLYLIAGDEVRFTATGQVITLPSGAGSIATPAGNGFPCTFACLLPSAQFGALIGRIGEGGPWFFVGSNSTLNVTQTGMLYLAVNDTIHTDNIGQFTVNTRVKANASFSCAASATAMCLNGGRFRIQVFWRQANGTTGNGQVSGCGTSNSGAFWFSEAANWDLMVKSFDGCRRNRRFWISSASTSTIEFTIRVRDTTTGEVKMYFNPQGQPAGSLTDTNAFSGC